MVSANFFLDFMFKLLFIILASLSFAPPCLGLQWARSFFGSRATHEIKIELFLNHLKAFIEEMHKLNLHKNEKSSGAVIQTPQHVLTLIFREKQKYMFFARHLPKSDNTVCNPANYELHKNRSELLAHAQSLKGRINPEALHSFSLFLDRIAINKTIEEIQTDRGMSITQKVKALEHALEELKDAEKVPANQSK
jgi:hypothetical protein